MRLPFKKKEDSFRLDLYRVVKVDGYEFIITGYSHNGSFDNRSQLTVDFEPLETYLESRRVK